jgi:hypothetical protein
MQPKVQVKYAHSYSFLTKKTFFELKYYKIVKYIYFDNTFIYNIFLKYYM